MFSLSNSQLLRPLRSRNVLIVTASLAVLYLLLQSYLLNNQAINQTIVGTYPFIYKFRLITQLLTGYFFMFPLSQLLFSLLTALLVGINFALVIALTTRLRQSGDMKMSFGGVGVLALVSSGCPSCGLSLLSFLGPSSGLVGVTLHSMLAQVIMLGILLFSCAISLKRLQASTICKR